MNPLHIPKSSICILPHTMRFVEKLKSLFEDYWERYPDSTFNFAKILSN